MNHPIKHTTTATFHESRIEERKQLPNNSVDVNMTGHKCKEYERKDLFPARAVEASRDLDPVRYGVTSDLLTAAPQTPQPKTSAAKIWRQCC